MDEQVRIRKNRSNMPKGLLGVVLCVLILLLGYQLWLSYRNQVRTAEIGTRNFASILETRFEAMLRRTEADLLALALEIPREALTQKAVQTYAREVNFVLDSRLYNVEEIAGYRIHDENGDALYASGSAYAQYANISANEYFRRLRDEPNAVLVFSEVMSGRSAGRQVLVIARALRNEHGKFMGSIQGLLNIDYYRRQFQSLDLGAMGIVELRRSDNHGLVVRYPDAPSEINRQLDSEHPVVQHIAKGERIFSLQNSAFPDGISRISGVHVIQQYPFYFTVGLAREDILADWRQQAMVVGISLLLLLLLFGVLFLRLGRMREREAGMRHTLEKSESQFRELAQMVPVGICHLDRSGKFTYVNSRYMGIIGRKREELLGLDWASFIHPEDSKKIRDEWENRTVPRDTYVCEYRYIRPDGQIVWVIGEVQSEVDSRGSIQGFIVAQTDITQLKQAEAELLIAKQAAESANMAKTRFLAAASHDLRQPIQAINLFRDALGRTQLDEEQKTIASFLSRSVHSLGDLLYSLLDISKLEAGLVKPKMSAVQVEDLFKAVDAEFSTRALEKNLRFKLFYPLHGLPLFTDISLVLSVLRNLIDNAFKYTELGGILVGVRKRGCCAVIQVWDTGIGIGQQHIGSIFEECYQVANPLRDRAKGLGLGLSIARRTARLLSGEVNVRSRPGCGTVFEIVLPLADPSVVASEYLATRLETDVAALEEKDYTHLKGWKVVVVEDDQMVAKSIELALKTIGMEVSLFRNAEMALTSTGIMSADFYISDFSLPGLNGLQFFDALERRSTAPINAVLVTGETSPERVALTTSSRWTVLFKPVELSRLLSVMTAVAMRRMRR